MLESIETELASIDENESDIKLRIEFNDDSDSVTIYINDEERAVANWSTNLMLFFIKCLNMGLDILRGD